MPRHPLSTTIKFLKLHDDVELPERKSDDAAGMDIRAYLPNGKVGIPPTERKIVNTGFKMELDPGYAANLLSAWLGPSVEGLDTEGEVRVLFRNLSTTTLILEPNTVLGTLRILPSVRVSIMEIEN